MLQLVVLVVYIDWLNITEKPPKWMQWTNILGIEHFYVNKLASSVDVIAISTILKMSMTILTQSLTDWGRC